MVFSSVVFLYIFLPILLICYFLVPSKFKNAIMIIASLVFFAWGEIRYIAIMLLLAVMDYVCGKKIDQNWENKEKKRYYLWFDIGVNILILFFFKYSDFIIDNINNLLHINIPLLNIPLPIGVSFNTFQSLSYIIDVYRGTVKCEKSFYNYLTYTLLFPQIIAGPIVRYETVDEELEVKNISIDNFSTGMRRFIKGLAKKVLIANQVGTLWHIIETQKYTQMSTLFAWTGIIAFALQIYFDFSGYSDMAIGLAQIFGMEFDENFNFPYISKSITEFWRRWHITLGSWFRDYIYIPLRRKQKRICKTNTKYSNSMVSNRSMAWSIMEFYTMGIIFWTNTNTRKTVFIKSIEKSAFYHITHIYNISNSNKLGNICF